MDSVVPYKAVYADKYSFDLCSNYFGVSRFKLAVTTPSKQQSNTERKNGATYSLLDLVFLTVHDEHAKALSFLLFQLA